MVAYVSHTTVNSDNAFQLSEWWKALLGYVDVDGDPNEEGHEECMILDPESGHHILFVEVPDKDAGKNRVHFDLKSRDADRDAEVERAIGLGATVFADRRGSYGPGSGWVTFTDPEGNEFCIVRA